MNKMAVAGAVIIIAFAAAIMNPNPTDHQKAVEVAMSVSRNDAAARLDLGSLARNVKSTLLGKADYTNLGLASLYTVRDNDQPVVRCFGAFGKVACRLIPAS